MKAYLLLILWFFILVPVTIGQIQFANRNDLLNDRDLHSAVPVGIADMNGDGLDDIVALDEGQSLYIQYQTPDPSRPFVRYEVNQFIDNNEQNDIIIADFNNDGANDILTVGSYDRVKVLYSIPHTFQFNLTHIVVTPFFSQGASAGDFNHDGWVDVVLLNDNGLNYTMINDGTGNLVHEDLFNFVTVPASDNSGNYGSVYTDFDMDGDLDFYIAKCRQGVDNQADPRRINALFVNDGEGNYTQNAAAYGLASGRQSWTADFGDIDNDGDLDCFMTQHDVICELFENIGNDTFVNITAFSDLNIGGVPLQGMFRDFDNDGFQDILVSGDRLDYYHNNGDKTFTKQTPFGNIVFGTFALGDLNYDGFTDVYASRVIPFNNPDLLREDILFLNAKNDHHFLSLSLKDTAGNPSAIGAMAILYGAWGIQVREVRGGEQYGVSNGHTLIFGLGEQTAYDSLIIRWPDGTRETYNDLSIDKNWSIRRGGCRKLPLEFLPALTVLCNDDSLSLAINPVFEFSGWSNGSFSDTIVVTQPGLYYASYFDNDGCLVRTSPAEVTIDPDTIHPTITYAGNPLLCNGEVALLSLPIGASYLWSSGDTTRIIEATLSGAYYALVEGYCKVQNSDTILLNFFIPNAPVTTQDTFLPDESALLMATGDSILWFADQAGTIILGSGNSLVLDDLTDTTTVYAQSFAPIEGLDFQLGPAGHQGNTKYNATFVNGGLLFEVYEPIVLHQLTVNTDSVGTRIIEITNGIDFYFEHQVDLEAGTTIVDLDVEIPVGAYTMSTNTDLNNLVFGVNSPYLWRSSEGVLFPYDVPGVVSINNSTFGEDFYYYFYDWKVSTQVKYCTSELVPATAFIDLGTAIEETGTGENGWTIAPNPTSGISNLWFRSDADVKIEVARMDGVRLIERNDLLFAGQEVKIDLSSYPSGIYLVRITKDQKSFTRKLIKL